MKRTHLSQLDSSLTYRFILPVIGENLLTILIGLIFSGIISVISASALAAIGMANTVMAVVNSMFSLVSTGASVLVARYIGAHENIRAGETVEQSTLIGALFSILTTVLTITLAVPTLRLLMPGAEAGMFGEAVRYYRILMLSLPFLVIHSLLSSVCRATGDSRNPLIVAILMNVAQLLFGWLFISVLHMEEIGAGLAYVCCRLLGASLMALLLFRDHRHFTLNPRNLLRPKLSVAAQIMRIGIPVSIESLFVQVGYMLANTMAIALGSFEAGVYQILTTINTFPTVPQTICATVSMSAIGHLLGAQKDDDARKAGRIIWAAGIAVSTVLCLLVMLIGVPFAGLYSSDSATIQATASLTWVLLVLDIAGVSINAIDPQLRAGGDVRFVMLVTLSAVWLIRLPLTYLFCFVFDMGVLGIFLGNTISLYYRAILGFVRHMGSKWIHKKL